MTCREVDVFLDPYLDGELGLPDSLGVERHLDECSTCTARHESLNDLRWTLRASSLQYEPSPILQQRVHAALVTRDRQERPPVRRWLPRVWSIAAVSISAAAFMAILWIRPAVDPIEREVLDTHIRSLLVNHLTDVPSTDQHTVKPWFAGKVDFSPPVRDFTPEGFPLVGGRLDYIDHHTAVAIVYRRKQHVINALIWPVHATDHGFRKTVDHGYQMIETVHSGMELWIVSDLNAAELTEFANLVVNPPQK